ncbi:MAG: radical SAM protein [Chloroflexi bacterium]|nr:radical SAM protein [Chloroflexota bacterium]MBI3166978.1 radical SAM protein [Chloroflexota bacterium]
MKLEGLHILLTYKCTYECDHCFVWGSPWQNGTLTLEQIENILNQAKDAGVQSIYFEGGEPFLFYAILKQAVHKAADMGFSVGIVSNAYWATSVADAEEWLYPLMGRLADLTVSSDLFHCGECLGERPQNAIVAAKWLGIPTGMISIAQPKEDTKSSHGQIEDESAVMYRGRAAEKLARKAPSHPWEEFDACPHEDLREPGRVHLDPFGNLHICQGIVIGNLFEKPLKQICEEYDMESHPICGLLHSGGPAALVTEYNLPHASSYADACHLCYEARVALRARFPDLLAPDQMYGVVE